MKTKAITLNDTKLTARMAISSSEQARGLMNVTSLPKDEGMLFCYPEEKHLSFWMKDTQIPLSIAFIDKDKRIIQIEDLEPFEEGCVKTSTPAKWALEVNRNWFNDNNIKLGDVVDIPGREIKIRVLKMPPEAKKLAKTIEDKLVDMTMKALKTKISFDKLSDLNIDVEVK